MQTLTDRIKSAQNTLDALKALQENPPQLPNGYKVAEVGYVEGKLDCYLPSPYSLIVVPQHFPNEVLVIAEKAGVFAINDSEAGEKFEIRYYAGSDTKEEAIADFLRNRA